MKLTQEQPLENRNPLGYQPIPKLLLTFSLPAIVSCLINSVYNIVDQIFIGQGVGYLGNAATTIAFPVMTIILAFSTLLGSGGSAYAAIRLGEKNHKEAERALNNVLMLSIIVGVAILILGLVFLDPILRLFGASDAVLPYARDYTSIILLGTPFNVLSIVLSNMARTDGSPRMSMYGMLIGAALNTVLDPIYIFVFGWGVKGAAVATITSQIISALILAWYFWKRGRCMHFEKKQLPLRGSTCQKVLVLGISSCITQSVACVMQVVMNNSLKFYGDQTSVGGDVAQSAMGIVMKIGMILASIGIGMGIGSQPILGFNFGARQPRRIKRTFLLAATAATAVVSLGWLVCQIFPEQIVQLFGGGNPEFMDFAVKCMRIYLGGVFCAGFQIVSTNYFQATGQPLKASVLSMLRQLLLLVPLLLILPLFFELNGILYAGPIADISSAVIVFFFIFYEMKKLNRWINRENNETPPSAAGPFSAT